MSEECTEVQVRAEMEADPHSLAELYNHHTSETAITFDPSVFAP